MISFILYQLTAAVGIYCSSEALCIYQHKGMWHTAQLLISCSLLLTCAATPLMLTVQTQSHEHMLRIIAQDSQRRLLGAMEATQSSVVDVENIDVLMPYETTHVQSVPTLSLLDSLAFDNITEEWSFTYETMALDTAVHGQINSYYRVLYLTRTEHNVGASEERSTRGTGI
jgi:hypothetical protein